jgi:tRNA(Ile)-lysidine synthase
VDDASNADTALRRNAVRHRLMPALEDLFPGAAVTLAQAAAQFAETAGLLDALARQDGAAAPEGLAVARLEQLDAARARNLLRHYLELHGHPIRRERLHEALAQMLEARADASPVVDFGAASLRRFQGRVVLVKHSPPPGAQAWHWQGEAELDLGAAGKLCFVAAAGEGVRLSGKVMITLRAGGEKLRPNARRPARTLKNLLREAGLPPWLRERLPLVYVEGHLAWAAEIGADAAFQAGPDAAGWLISWRQPG